MSLYAPAKTLSASTVCDQCRKRKKSCSKTLPSCSRCSRFLVKCTYSHQPVENGVNLPPLVAIIPGLAPTTNATRHWNYPYPQPLGVDEQISAQAARLLNAIARKRGAIDVFISAYFRDFHRSLPILDQDAFYAQLQLLQNCPNSHFSILLLSMILISHLSSKVDDKEGKDAEELYPTLKNIYGLLTSTGRVTMELVQAGVVIAAWEHCQGLGREGWLSIGCCARMGNVLGLHHTIREEMPESIEERRELETRRCLWWGIVVLERIINLEYGHNKFPFASQAPALGDFLPLIPDDRETLYPVSTDLITPDMTVYEGAELFNREFTRLGNFGSTIQSTYLSSLVTRHITDESKCHASREDEAGKLDMAVQSFACTLIPPPGMADGQYCGAYGLRTLSIFTLHLHSYNLATQTGNTESITRATIALQSLSRILIHMTKAGNVGRPLDYDAMAFWAHAQCAQAALAHIRFGERNEEWEADLEMLKGYLRGFMGRFGLYENYLKQIEQAERTFRTSCSLHTVSSGTAMESGEPKPAPFVPSNKPTASPTHTTV